MNDIVPFLSQPLVALTVTQIMGLAILLAGLDNDEDIAARSGTYFDYNPHMLKHLVSNNYDQKIGLFVVTLPTILQATNEVPFWSSYLCLLIGLILRFTPLRVYRISKRTEKITAILNKRSESL
jgi:hypothetical protein